MKSNQLDTFKSHLIRLIKEELEGGEDEKQAGLEKALYDTVLAPSDVNAAIAALSDVKNYGIYAQNLRDPKAVLRVFGPPVPATKGRVAKETWDQSNENERLSKVIDIKSRVPQEWAKVEQQLQSKFDDWSIENDNDSFNEFIITLDAKDLPMDFFGKYASNYFATKTPENLKKYSGVMTKDNQFIVNGDKIVFPAKKNPFQTRDYLEKVLKTIMGNAKIQYTLSQQESEDQPKTTSNTQGAVEKINFVKTFDTPELAAKFKRLIPKDFAEKTSVEGGKITVADITDPQKKNLMATALKFIADNTPKKKPMKESVKDQIRKAIMEVIKEKKLTKAELKKREEILKAMKGTTNLPAPAMYAIATAKAKKLAEDGIDEARFEKGEDIGKKGPGFKKVAAAAAKEYGSKEAGKKVAGAILKKVMKEGEGSLKNWKTEPAKWDSVKPGDYLADGPNADEVAQVISNSRRGLELKRVWTNSEKYPVGEEFFIRHDHEAMKDGKDDNLLKVTNYTDKSNSLYEGETSMDDILLAFQAALDKKDDTEQEQALKVVFNALKDKVKGKLGQAANYAKDKLTQYNDSLEEDV
jgi:hypothetical protein